MRIHVSIALVVMISGSIPFFHVRGDSLSLAVDSLEKARLQLYKDAEAVQQRLDSVHNYIREELKKEVMPDTIVGMAGKDGIAYKKPDILAEKKYKVKTGEIVVIIGFWKEWFKIITNKGTGFVLEDVIKHDDKIFYYKKMQMKKYATPSQQE